MKIALLGATGMIGSRFANEALSRGHSVAAIVRDTSKLVDKRLVPKLADATNAATLARALPGHDAVVSALGPTGGEGASFIVQATRNLIDALPRTGVKRVLIVGGAGSLEVKPGVQLVDTPEFPAAWKPAALAAREALLLWRKNASLDWTYVSPAGLISPGPRTGRYRTGGDQLLTDAKGESRISAEDFAVALVDELEKAKHLRKRVTFAY
jgi:putative NADH-flavin reductase